MPKPTDLLEPALEALRRTTGLQGTILPHRVRRKADHAIDATVALRVDKKTHRLAVQTRRTLDRATALPPLKTWLEQIGRPGMIVTDYATATVADKCRELDVPFIDTAGNAYLKLPGLFVFVTGQKPLATEQAPHRGLATATDLRIKFALLCRPELINATYREIQEAAGVALGAIGQTLAQLRRQGHLAGRKKGHRKLLAPERLLDEWVVNYPTRLRPRLNPRRFRGEDPTWWKKARVRELGAQWGGEVAADRLTHMLKAAAATIYVAPEPERNPRTRLIANYRLHTDPRGNTELLDKFWHFPANPKRRDIAPPILVYADLLQTLEPRNLEVAKVVRERFIDFADREK